MGRLAAEASSVPGLTGLALIGVEPDGGYHILHSLLSIPVGTYDQGRWLFGCYGELPLEGFPAITEILVISFAAQRGVSAMPWEYHIVHMEGLLLSIWRMKP